MSAIFFFCDCYFPPQNATEQRRVSDVCNKLILRWKNAGLWSAFETWHTHVDAQSHAKEVCQLFIVKFFAHSPVLCHSLCPAMTMLAGVPSSAWFPDLHVKIGMHSCHHTDAQCSALPSILHLVQQYTESKAPRGYPGQSTQTMDESMSGVCDRILARTCRGTKEDGYCLQQDRFENAQWKVGHGVRKVAGSW